MRKEYNSYEDDHREHADPQEVQQALQRLREVNQGLRESLQAFHEVLSDITNQAEANGGRIVSANEILESILAEQESGAAEPEDLDSWFTRDARQSTAKPSRPADGNEILRWILGEREK